MPSNCWADTEAKEKAWKRAKEIFKDQTDKAESNWDDSEWAQVMAIAKNIYQNEDIQSMNRKDNIIEIKEEVQIGDYLLEKGDKIKVLTEESIISGESLRDTELLDTISKQSGRMRKKEALPRNFRDIPIVSKGGFGPEVERMIRDEIIAREDELRQKYQDYIDDTGDRATSFAEFARMIIATEEGLIEKGDNTMRKRKVQEADIKKIIKDLAKSYGDSNEDQGKIMTIKEEVQINDIILEVGDRIKVLRGRG